VFALGKEQLPERTGQYGRPRPRLATAAAAENVATRSADRQALERARVRVFRRAPCGAFVKVATTLTWEDVRILWRTCGLTLV